MENAPPLGGAMRREVHPAYVVYQHLREFVGAFCTSGWRHAFCWGGIGVVLLAYVARINGADIDLRDYRDLAGIILGAFVFRGAVDKGGLIPLAEIMFSRRTPAAAGAVG